MLDQGLLVESGEPHDLLQQAGGIFSGMVAQTGPSSSLHLREVARMASFGRVASRNALQLHHRQHAGVHPLQLRQQSEVLGRRYVDDPVTLEQQQVAAGDGAGSCVPAYTRSGSELNRSAVQVRPLMRDRHQRGVGCV